MSNHETITWIMFEARATISFTHQRQLHKRRWCHSKSLDEKRKGCLIAEKRLSEDSGRLTSSTEREVLCRFHAAAKGAVKAVFKEENEE